MILVSGDGGCGGEVCSDIVMERSMPLEHRLGVNFNSTISL